MTGRYRCFCRKVWQPNSDWPYGWEPHAEMASDCRTLASFNTREEAIDFCERRNRKWRKHTYRELKELSHAQRRVYFSANRYEWTDDIDE